MTAAPALATLEVPTTPGANFVTVEADEEKNAGKEAAADFFLENETRWLATTLLFRALIRRISDAAGSNGHRFTAAIFDDVSASIDKTLDEGGSPKVAAKAHELINDLAAAVVRATRRSYH